MVYRIEWFGGGNWSDSAGQLHGAEVCQLNVAEQDEYIPFDIEKLKKKLVGERRTRN